MKKEPCKVEAQVLVQHLHPAVSENIGESSTNNPAAIESMEQGPALDAVLLTKSELQDQLKAGYKADTFFSKIVENPKDHVHFRVENRLVWHLTREGRWVIGVPRI